MTKRASSRHLLAFNRLAAMDAATSHWRHAFLASLGNPLATMQLFDRMPHVVFSIKDRDGRYVCVSLACAARCGLANPDEAIGRTAHDLFPSHMADRYARQDEVLFRTGRPICNHLDPTLFPDRSSGWCRTDKFPLHDRDGTVIGLSCVSQDLDEQVNKGLIDSAFAATIDYLRAHHAETLRIPQLARMAKLSVHQFDRLMRLIFGISAMRFLINTRIEAVALALSDTDAPIASLALDAGFCDQSALSRQFRQVTGFSPRHFRHATRGAPSASVPG
jgi:AraC-like DNA-binding protein